VTGAANGTAEDLRRIVLDHRGWLTLTGAQWCNNCDADWPCPPIHRVIETINANAATSQRCFVENHEALKDELVAASGRIARLLDEPPVGYLIARPVTNWGTDLDIVGPGGLDDYALQAYPTPGAAQGDLRPGDRLVKVVEA
jgi:hypothetical protein